jgi:hypothetical protein
MMDIFMAQVPLDPKSEISAVKDALKKTGIDAEVGYG